MFFLSSFLSHHPTSLFRDNLDAEIWECPGGHGFCGDCVDKEHLGDNPAFEEDEAEMGSDGIFRNKGLESLRRIVNNEASEDTLWLCTKDDDEESVTLTETTGNKEESTIWKFKKKFEKCNINRIVQKKY